MMRSNRKPGFLLIEALIAIVMVALILTPIYILQTTLLQNIVQRSDGVARLFAAKNYMFEVIRKQPPYTTKIKEEKELDDPPMRLTFERRKVNEKSSLQDFKDLYFDVVQASDKRDTRQKERILRMVYQPEQKQEQKKA